MILMMRKITRLSKLFLVLLVLLFLVCGCSNQEDVDDLDDDVSKKAIVDEDFDREGSGTLKCVTAAYAEDGVDVDLSYVVTYKNGNILRLKSKSVIISSNQESLDKYEDAYKNISVGYKGLKYYEAEVLRESDKVTYNTSIDYSNIDIDKLLDIEGEEDNIIKKGKAKLSLWLDLAEKIGTTCEEA